MSRDRNQAVARFRLTQEEYTEGLRALMTGQLSFLVGPLTGVIFLTAGLVEGSPALALLGVAVLTVVAIAWRVVPVASFKRRPQFADEQTHTFNDDGIVIRAEGRSGNVPWAFYRQVRETGRLYLLMRGPRHANFLPKRAFASSAEEDRFREMAAAKLPTRLRPR